MGKIVNKIIQAIEQNDQTTLAATVQDGCKRNKLTLKKLEKVAEKCPLDTVQNIVQGVKTLLQTKCLKLKESELIECAFLVETAVSVQNPYIAKGHYDIQFDPATSQRYIHTRDDLIGKGFFKKVYKVIRYDRLQPKVLVSCEAKGALTDELQAMEKAKGLHGVIQAKAVLTRTNSKGELKTAIIQKMYSPGPLYKAASDLSQQEQTKIASDLLYGLQGLHSRNLIHRDIKTDNILYDKATQEAVLGDLGQAKELHTAHDLVPNATCLYNPPEALGHDRTRIDLKKAELFSLGCALYKMHFQKRLPWMKTEILSQKILGNDYRDKEKKKKFIKKLKLLRYKLGLSIENKPNTPKTCLKRTILRMLHQEPEKRPDISELLAILKGDRT